MNTPNPRRRWRSTIRVRLTLLYAGAFLLAGAILITLLYLYLAHALDGQLASRADITNQLHQSTGASLHLPPEAQEQLHARFRQDRDHVLKAMLIASLISLAAVGVAATGFGWLMAGRALRPLQQITATARRVAERSLHERIALDGPHDEIKDLADTFDAMLERLDHSFDGQRRFVANASHELRTPLTLNRTLIEVTLDDPAVPESTRRLGTTLLAVNQRHERLIDGLLTLATSEQALTQHTLVDLADVAAHATTICQDAAHRAGLDLDTDVRPAPVSGDPILLERLVHNLLDNAVRYNLPEHGTIAVTTDVVEGWAELTVTNTGPLVAAYEIPALFEPFRRLPSAERLADSAAGQAGRGAGLGLSIVAAVAHAHGGEVHAVARPGGGLTIQVRIPATLQATHRPGT